MRGGWGGRLLENSLVLVLWVCTGSYRIVSYLSKVVTA